MNEELISIVIPIYNVECYVTKCIETVAAQTYKKLEIILVDDGSTDLSGSICDEFAKKDKRTKIIHQNNKGLWAARNAGQKIAKGNYIMFVDGDDYIHLDTVRALYQAINFDREYDISIVDYKKTSGFDEDVLKFEEGEIDRLTQNDLVSKLFNGQICRNVWNKLYRRTLIENIYANDYPRAQDFEFNIRVFMAANSAVLIHRVMYFWVQRPSSLTYQTDYWDIVYSCFAKMFYENYVNLPSNKRHFEHYLLSDLYKKMVFWKNRSFRTCKECEVFAQCHVYEKATRKDYWLCWRINPLEKIGVTFLLHNPRLTRWLMKVTKNY